MMYVHSNFEFFMCIIHYIESAWICFIMYNIGCWAKKIIYIILVDVNSL